MFKMLLHSFISMIFFTTEICTVYSAIVQINCNLSSHDFSIVGFEEELLKVIPPSLILDERKGAIS